MKRLLPFLTIATILASCGTSNTSSTVKNKSKIAKNPTTYAETITASDLKTLLYTYASDEYKGRETGEEGQKMAVNFIKQHYIEDGIPAAKSDGDYFQNVPLEIMSPADVRFSIKGKTYEGLEELVSLTPSMDTSINANEIVYAGYGIEDKNYSDYKNIDVKDKIVLFKSGEPKSTDGIFAVSGTNEGSQWSSYREQFSLKREVAEKKGAKAVLFYYPKIYPMLKARFGSSSGRMSLVTYANEMLFFIVNENISKALVKDIETNDTAKSISVDFSLDYKNKSKQIASENVAAIIRGNEKPNEYIIISAHLDHEGVKNGEIYNGADDDGSGTVAIIEMAQAFAKAESEGNGPKRSIVFLNVTAEEKGLLGSKYYTDINPIFPLADTVANLNIDMIGRLDPKREKKNRNYVYLIGSDKLSTELHKVSEMINAKYMNIDLDYKFNEDNDPNRFYYRSDHYNFAKNNVPVIFYFNGTHEDYHKPGDTPDKIQYDLLENRTRLVFYTAWELANRDARIALDKINE